MPSPRRLLSVVALAAILAVPVRATQVVRLDTAELARTSHAIVVGRVEDTQSHWNAARTKIVTDVRVTVDESLKGDGAPTLVLTQLGGEVDGARYNVPGCPVFRKGEEALLFVWRDAQGRSQVNGMAQGKFDITTDAATSEKMVQRSLPGLAVRDARTLSAVPTGRRAASLRLSDFRTVIRQALEVGGDR